MVPGAETALGNLSGNYLIAARPAALEEPLRKSSRSMTISSAIRATLEWINDNPKPWASQVGAVAGL